MATRLWRFLSALLLSFQMVSCSGTGLPSVRAPVDREESKLAAAKRYFSRAQTLEKNGLHLEASIYFEAALDGGVREEEVLPLLVISLVRAGRLEAAKQSIDRFAEIAPENKSVVELQILLSSMTQRPSSNSAGVVR